MFGTTPNPRAFRALFEAVEPASIAVSADATLTILALSDSYADLVRSTRDQLEGQSLFDTAPFCQIEPAERAKMRASLELESSPDDRSTPPTQKATLSFLAEDAAMWTVTLQAVISELVPDSPIDSDNSIPDFEAERGRPGGPDESIDRPILMLTLSPSYGDSPATGSLGQSHDERDSHFLIPQDLFHAASLGFAVLHVGGDIVHCNPAFAGMAGRSRTELQQMTLAMLIDPEDRPQSVQAMERLADGLIPSCVIEQRFLRPDGSVAWVRSSMSPLHDAAGKPSRLFVLSEDLTLLRMAERALIRNEKLAAVGRLSASIAHELNNPLEAVTNLIFLVSQATEVDDMRRYALLAEQELARVTQIATQTLRFYRHETKPSQVELTDIVDSVLALFEGRLRRRHVSIRKDYEDDGGMLLAYGGELRQVFVNLIGNALDAMGEHGVLRVRIRRVTSWRQPGVEGVRVVIADTGSGIPRAMLSKVFEPFVSTKESAGTGLGLWISKEIIRRHSGHLRVRSSVERPHRGTVISVFLPADGMTPAL